MKLGIDIFKEDFKKIVKHRNIALVSSSAACDSSGTPVFQIIKKCLDKKLKAIWSLQHGFFIDKQDNMVFSDSFFWEDFEVEVRSLYRETCLPDESWLEGIDALVVDIFDVGTRVYTYLNHLIMILKFLSARNIDIIILDRANPLNGIDLEGSVCEEEYFSLVGQLPVPMRHGLTIGESLNFALGFYKIALNLEIIKMSDWDRRRFFEGIWTYPSPNMPSLTTAITYPGGVMLEGTNISEGRGTTRPFEFIGSPFVDNFQIIEELKSLKLPGVIFIPVFFKPEFSKFSGEVCKGIYIYVDEVREFKSFQTYYEIIRIILAKHSDGFYWQKPPYEFEAENFPIDMICGTDLVRKSLEKNRQFSEIKPDIDQQIVDYREKIDRYLLY